MNYYKISTWYPMILGTVIILAVLAGIWWMMRSVEKAHLLVYVRAEQNNARNKERRTHKEVAKEAAKQDERWSEVASMHRNRAIISMIGVGAIALETLLVSILMTDKIVFVVIALAVIAGYSLYARRITRPLPRPASKVTDA